MSRAVVLGAAGFIGRHVCRELARLGFEVVGMGHGSWADSPPEQWGIVRWVEADIDPASLATLATGGPVDVYLHCAGGSAVGPSYTAPLADFHRTVSTTAALLEHARLVDPGSRVVLTSSAAVYGDQGDVDLTEVSTRSPMSPYGFNKQAAELICDSYARIFGLRIGIVRLFSVYGEGLRKQLLWDAARKLDAGEYQFFGTGHELRDWLHVEDAASLLASAATCQGSQFEVYNGGHVHASTRELLDMLAGELGVRQQPRFNGESHSGNPHRLTADCSHARTLLHWQPRVTLADGISRYVRWYRGLANQRDTVGAP